MAIVIVEPSSSGLALLKTALGLGGNVYCFAANSGDRVVETLPDENFYLVEVETLDPQCIVDAVSKIDEVVTAVVPGFEYVVESVAAANAMLGLPHLSESAAALTRNKHELRVRLNDAGVSVPRFFEITEFNSIARACEHVGFPAVLKPIDGCGSLLVKRVDCFDDVSSALTGIGYCFQDMGKSIGVSYMLEQYICGSEYSVEGYVSSSGIVIVAVTEKMLGDEPFFVEMGHVVNAEITADEKDRIVKYIKEVVRVLEITMGVFHAELRLENGKPVLIEIAARLGGDRIYRLVELTCGISLPEIMIHSYQGKEIKPSLVRSDGVATVRFFAPPEGICPPVENDFAQELRGLAGVVEFEAYYLPGTRLPPLKDFRGRMGHVLIQAPTRNVLDVEVSKIMQKIHDYLDSYRDA